MKKLITILFLFTFLFSCIENSPKYEQLRKLSSEELIARAKSNNWPDINKVIYVMGGDTISFDSVQRLNYHEIAFDDYVNSNGEVVLAEVREIIESDRLVRKRMNQVSKKDNLNGQLETIQLFSNSLNQKRDLTVFTPKEGNSNKILYFTDGTIVADIAKSISPLIDYEVIQPIVLVGIHSDYEYRSQEYVKYDDYQELFENHFEFFTNEVPNFLEKEGTITLRYLFGFSNGADFCNYIGIHYPEWTTKIMAMSGVAYFPTTVDKKEINIKYPDFILSSGIDENLSAKNLQLKENLTQIGASVNYEEHQGGHEYKIWKERILDFIVEEFNTNNQKRAIINAKTASVATINY